MKKKILPILGFAIMGVASSATTNMIIKQTDGTKLEFDVDEVLEVTFTKDSVSAGGDEYLDSGAPCVAMCDNEMAVKTLKIVGNNLLAPLKAKFWDGSAHTIIASTEDGSISIDDGNHATITIPEGVADNGTIVFENEAGESETEFIFRDTRNLLITHDDPELNIFNSNKPDAYRVDEETGDTIVGLPIPKETLKSTIFASDNTRGDFSIFYDIDGYTAWTYSPKGESNPDGIAPKYPTPFGCFSESIDKGETTFNDYVIKFEVFVPKEYPINGNGLAISFYNKYWQDLRVYCAFWQPSKTSFAKNADGEWQEKAEFEDWTSGGDWLTISIPMEEIRYDFTAKNYYWAAQNDRIIEEAPGYKYGAYGDKENGLPFFDNPEYAKLSSQLLGSKVNAIQSIGLEFGNADQPNTTNEPLIAVDNLRIVPKDNNGSVYPFLKWGQPTRDFYTAPVYNCK